MPHGQQRHHRFGTREPSVGTWLRILGAGITEMAGLVIAPAEISAMPVLQLR